MFDMTETEKARLAVKRERGAALMAAWAAEDTEKAA